MRTLLFIALLLVLPGCAVLKADFEDDRIGSNPSIFPEGDPEDEIRLSFPFSGSVVGSPFRFGSTPRIRTNGTQALEVTRNSSVTFISAPIAENRSRSRHRISFLYRDGTTRGLSIGVSAVGRSIASVRLEGNTVVLRRSGIREDPIATIPVGTENPSLKFVFIVDPETGTVRALISTRDETYGATYSIAAPGTLVLEGLSLSFRVDNGGQFPRGLFVVDDVYASWNPRIRFGAP